MFCSFLFFAQEPDSTVKSTSKFVYDTLRIVNFPNKLAVYFNLSGKMNNIDIQSKTSAAHLQLSPNEITSLGLGFDYKWIGFGLSFGLPFMNRDNEIYGETEKFDFQINYYQNRFGIDAYFKYHKGFYLRNPEDFTDWSFEDYPVLPEMEAVGLGLSAYYIFNYKKFSYKAVFPRTMWQKKSAGSLIAGTYLHMNVCNSPGGIIPPELPDSLNSDFDLLGFANTYIGISIGYTYTWVIKKRFFMNLSVVPGIGIAWPEVSTTTFHKKYDGSSAASVISRLSLGYEGKKLYYGFNLVSIINNFNYENIEVSSTTGNLRFYIGKRFNVEKMFKRKSKSETNDKID